MYYESALEAVIKAAAYVEVKNLKGSDDSPLPDGCSSWKDYWENKTKRKFATCSCRDCESKATDGAHVQKVKVEDRSWYIVPLCHACNTGKDGSFHVLREDLVSVR